MQIFINKPSDTLLEVRVEIPAEDFEIYLNRAAKSLSEDLEIQGFRKGNAPLNIVEQKVGSKALLGKAADIAMQASYIKALDENANSEREELNGKLLRSIVEGLSRHALSEVNILKLARGNPFSYKIIFRTPFFDIAKDYKTIANNIKNKEAKEVTVDEKEIEDALKWLQASYNKSNNNVENKTQELPEFNNEFAKTVGNFSGLEDLKQSIREGLHMEKERKEKDRVRMYIIKEIIEKSRKDIPREVLERETKNVEEEFRARISEMGIEFDEYLKKIAKKRDDLEPGWRDSAMERIEISMTLDTVAAKESIEPSEEDIESESQKILNRFSNVKDADKKISTERLREYVYGALRNEKTFEFLEKC